MMTSDALTLEIPMESFSNSPLKVDELQFLAAIRKATPEQRRNLVRLMRANAETSAKPFPKKVRRELKRLSITQLDVVAALGVDGGKVFNKVMRDQQPATFDLLVSLAGLGFDVSYLVTGFYQGGGLGEAALHYVVLDAVDLLSLENKIDAKQLANAVGKLSAKHRRTGGVIPATGLFDRTKSGVVRVYKHDGDKFFCQSTGSIVGDGSYVLTCAHSVDDCESVLVHPYEKDYAVSSKVIYTDKENDIALISVPETVGNPIPFDWNLKTMVGDGAVIIGFPLASIDATLVSAHISAHTGHQFRIDATVNKGSSGSPVLNLKGELVGVVRVKFHSLPELLDELDSAPVDLADPAAMYEGLVRLKELSKEIRSNVAFGLGEASSISALIQPFGRKKLTSMLRGEAHG